MYKGSTMMVSLETLLSVHDVVLKVGVVHLVGPNPGPWTVVDAVADHIDVIGVHGSRPYGDTGALVVPKRRKEGGINLY